MNKQNIILIIIVALLALGIYWLATKKTTSRKPTDTIIVGTNAEFPPFTFINDKGEIVGFDIDIAKEVLKRLGKKMTIKDMSFDALIPEIQIGSIHLIAAGMTATPERAKQVLFTKPYLQGEPLVVVTLKENPISKLEDLNTKTVIVNEGYTADTYMSALQGPKIKRLATPVDAMLDLSTGKSFAYASALNAVKPLLEKYGKDKFNVFPIEGTSENTAMGISKKYPELLPQIQAIFDQMMADGTINTLKKKWNVL